MLKFSNIEIEQPDRDKLILRIKCFVLYLLRLFSLGTIILLLSLSLWIPSLINLTCHKNQTQTTNKTDCKLARYNLWGIRKEETRIFASNYRLVIEDDYLGNSKDPDYKVVLIADNERIKIANYGGHDNYKNALWKKQSQQINDFTTINENRLDSLIVSESNVDTIYTIIFIIFVILAIYSIIQVVKINTILTLSKESKTLSIRKYNHFREEISEVKFDKIDRVFLETSDGIDDLTSRIVFKLKSGETIPLTSWLDSFENKSVVKRINRFSK